MSCCFTDTSLVENKGLVSICYYCGLQNQYIQTAALLGTVASKDPCDHMQAAVKNLCRIICIFDRPRYFSMLHKECGKPPISKNMSGSAVKEYNLPFSKEGFAKVSTNSILSCSFRSGGSS